MIDRIIQGIIFMVMLLAIWGAYRALRAALVWLRHNAARSLGRASGRAAGVSRELAEGFKEGLRKKE
jgi:hypothetical protein